MSESSTSEHAIHCASWFIVVPLFPSLATSLLELHATCRAVCGGFRCRRLSSIEQLESKLDEVDEYGDSPLEPELVLAFDGAWERWCALGPERQPMNLGHMDVAKL